LIAKILLRVVTNIIIQNFISEIKKNFICLILPEFVGKDEIGIDCFSKVNYQTYSTLHTVKSPFFYKFFHPVLLLFFSM